MSKKYDWDLIERLLHEVQNGAGKPFAPRKHAEELAQAKAQVGESVESLDALKMQAADLEALLLKRGFIASRPEEEGGNGENFILTALGSRLLAMIDSSIPGNDHPRQVLDEQADALDPATFEQASSKAQVAHGVI
ncbi:MULTISPECIES: transcriptional regulator [unclassified Pseudomonas]|uniref:transcriptional regulator n=1 Tax=unclassified Pseudomonas TaxID=196821 RepID=UPI0025EAD057|nr:MULTISPECIES: transcriptional regulator [unclassified Pseudomonas]